MGVCVIVKNFDGATGFINQGTNDANCCRFASSIPNAIEQAIPAEEIMIIGGAQLYEQMLPIANRIYLTKIELHCEGDTYFPDWDENDWQEINHVSHLADTKNPYNYDFITLQSKTL